MANRYQLALDEIMVRVAKTNNIYSFLEFYSGVFLPKDASVERTESLEKRIDVSSV